MSLNACFGAPSGTPGCPNYGPFGNAQFNEVIDQTLGDYVRDIRNRTNRINLKSQQLTQSAGSIVSFTIAYVVVIVIFIILIFLLNNYR